MTASNILSNIGLVVEQDVTNSNALRSLCYGFLQMANSMIEHKTKKLRVQPIENLVDEISGHCLIYNLKTSFACEHWTMDVDFVRERMLHEESLDLDAATEYILGMIRDGPLGKHCIWTDGRECVWHKCHSGDVPE